MQRVLAYSGALTAEQFLFHEIRIVSKFFMDEKSVDEALVDIKTHNLFQYPTEREVSRMTRACYRRLAALDSRVLVNAMAQAPIDIAKQIVGLQNICRYGEQSISNDWHQTTYTHFERIYSPRYIIILRQKA